MTTCKVRLAWVTSSLPPSLPLSKVSRTEPSLPRWSAHHINIKLALGKMVSTRGPRVTTPAHSPFEPFQTSWLRTYNTHGHPPHIHCPTLTYYILSRSGGREGKGTQPPPLVTARASLPKGTTGGYHQSTGYHQYRCTYYYPGLQGIAN